MHRNFVDEEQIIILQSALTVKTSARFHTKFEYPIVWASYNNDKNMNCGPIKAELEAK